MNIPGITDPSRPRSDSPRERYRSVILALLGTAFAGVVGAVAASVMLGNAVLLHVAVTLEISTGILIGVAAAQAMRARPAKTVDAIATPASEPDATSSAAGEVPRNPDDAANAVSSPLPSRVDRSRVSARLAELTVRAREWISNNGELQNISMATAIAGAVTSVVVFQTSSDFTFAPTAFVAAVVAALFLCSAGLAATAVRYLAELDPAQFPEGFALCKGARVVVWILVVGALSIGVQWMGELQVLRILGLIVLAVNLSVCYGLIANRPAADGRLIFPLDLGVLSTLGSRTNVLASILDSAERQLGIDLRSTWALTVVRHSLEPLVIGLFAVGWLSTSLTVVGVQEQGLVERLGVPVDGPPLLSGIHVHWPLPIDRVIRIPVQRVQLLTVGHEGQEEGGPENVLWARQHAANEYTLLLGNGRDLITVDAAVQFRIADARAWWYHSQNPADALRAIAYRAVMRTTVNRTLAEALSENLKTMTAHMQTMVQEDADALGLGVEVLGFTVGGMHPPVMVALEYQAVVSAELGKVTAVVNAQQVRNRTVPYAEAAVLRAEYAARSEGAEMLATAAGDAWSFLTLQSQYRAAPEEYFFRRRLETLEKGLSNRRFTVLDSRFQRDGGELWMIP
jgi:regulator of protease activity HflC (stomatin/prohibitin superfamily)